MRKKNIKNKDIKKKYWEKRKLRKVDIEKEEYWEKRELKSRNIEKGRR